MSPVDVLMRKHESQSHSVRGVRSSERASHSENSEGNDAKKFRPTTDANLPVFQATDLSMPPAMETNVLHT